jgi:signal recognition particle receptor subunit beta
MAVINYSKKEISAKIVYYGPSLCGKTTNIQSIYASVKPEQKGKLVSLATEADRTLFFDFLPIEIANIRGFKTRLHFYTVPGQVYYNSTRRAVLTGVDGLVFVADSQRDKMEENVESLNNLEENLNYYGKSLKTIPLVIQYNKRDLPDVTPISEMEQILNANGYPCVEAVAATGEGVLETLTKITKMVLQHIEMGTSGKQQRPAAPVSEKTVAPPASPKTAPTSFMPKPADSASIKTVEEILDQHLPGPEPAAPVAAPYKPVRELPPEHDPSLRRPVMEPLRDIEAPASYKKAPEPVQAEPVYEIDQGYSLPEEPGTLSSPELASPGEEKRTTIGRLHIVGTENAEIISANAVQLPIKVQIEGDTRTYRMDLAIKLDGFKPEE